MVDEAEPEYTPRSIAKDIDRSTRAMAKDILNRVADYTATGADLRVTIHIRDFRSSVMIHTAPQGEGRR